MFNKFARIENQKERLEIYNLLKFNLSVCLRLAEFMALVLLIFGLGWFVGTESARVLNPAFGPWAGAGAGLFLMILIPALLRLPFLLALGRLRAAFKVDPRSDSGRARAIAAVGLRRLAAVWALSMVLYAALVKLDLWQWTVLALVLGAALVTVNAFFPRLLRPQKLRPLREGDLSPSLLAQIESWKPKTGFSSRDIFISSGFCPELSFPKLTGLGPTAKLVIQERALATFPPRELSILVVTGVLEALVKGPLKIMLLRFCSLAVAVPLAAIFISTAGTSLWGYPVITNPVLVTLMWAAAWVGLNISDFTIRFTGRGLTVQLAAAAAMVTRDEGSLETALATMAQKNLEDEAPPAWRELFRCQYSRHTFIKRVKYHQHMSKFSEYE